MGQFFYPGSLISIQQVECHACGEGTPTKISGGEGEGKERCITDSV